jgi:hypothetical protein
MWQSPGKFQFEILFLSQPWPIVRADTLNPLLRETQQTLAKQRSTPMKITEYDIISLHDGR